jgi:hypothetical protein
MATVQDDEVEFVPIPLDRETRARLVAVSNESGRHPVEVAGAMLRDVLQDDADAHRPAH